MTGVSFSVSRRYVDSRRKQLYTHSLTFRNIFPSKLGLSLSKVERLFSSIVNKILLLQGSRLFFMNKRVNYYFKNIKSFSYAFRELYLL